MKKLFIVICLCLFVNNIFAQKEKIAGIYGAAHYQLTSYGIGAQIKTNIWKNIYIANNAIVFFDNESEVDKMINLDANFQYQFSFRSSIPEYQSLFLYPFVGIGWANYKTEYFINHYGDAVKDIESAIGGNSVFFNIGVGGAVRCFDNINIGIDYKLAMTQGRKHSSFLLGLGFVF